LNKILISLGIIVCGLSIGYGIQVLVQRNLVRLPVSLEALRKGLQKTALLFVLPLTITGAIWATRVQSAAIAALPFLGVAAIMLGGVLSLAAARGMRLPPRQTGALYPCGSFTNIGSIGALVCFVFLGEEGFALVPIYKVFEEITYYGVGFPIAKYYSTTDSDTGTGWERAKRLASDPFILVAIGSIALGVALNISRIPRPEIFRTINAVFIPLGTGMLLISIGLSMRFSRMGRYLKPCLAVGTIKFLAVPLVISSTAFFMGYANLDGGLPLKVVIILSSMPVAFNALIPPSIYDLDLDLANACWFFSTACLVLVLPILLAVIRNV